jgi:anti-anti-sigma factor
MFNINESKDNAVITLSIEGELTTDSSPDLEKRLNSLLQEGENRIVIVCKNLSLVTSSGLRVFLAFAKRIKREQGEMALCEMPDNVYEVFEMSGFNAILNILPDTAQAVAAISPD